MALSLRPYQLEVLHSLRNRLKETEHPLLVNASVGAGKSLIIAELLLLIERANWRALCLTMNSTLIMQNAETYKCQGGNCGIFCAALNKKQFEEPVIFASPQSIERDLRIKGKIAQVPFNLIVIDECHNINVAEPSTIYMKIFNWYKAMGHKIRFVGLTGTPFRGKGHKIVGDDQFFKEEVCAITTGWLVQNNYLAKPVWGYTDKQYEFNKLQTNSMGKFNQEEVKQAMGKAPRLTGMIMQEVQSIVAGRCGAFIFATSIEHCHECAMHLPEHETAIITGLTPDHERQKYIADARNGQIKYLINVNVLCAGVDVANFDTVVFVRPTESLVLYTQAIGRGLRLSKGKTECLVLDYAGNLERHGDIDDPLINEALQPKTKDDPEYCIPCYKCQTFNKMTTRRCIGVIDNARCEHYFDFKPCIKCAILNDITARYCRGCKFELLDPNRNLKLYPTGTIEFDVHNTYYGVKYADGRQTRVIFFALYRGKGIDRKYVNEEYITWTKRGRDYFYANFVKKYFKNPSKVYRHLDNYYFLSKIINKEEIMMPSKLILIPDNDKYKIIYKVFE